ncbi:exonuclease domain-containing protein [Ningiella sp. W23]|uniref:exonuclease domain-containing protein n=1 Tax=Ningiella sp. W23 TaxID=3023715 RepID=UPI00375649CA
MLHKEHLSFLESFHLASKDQQCALVRCINRKHSAVKISSLRFEELPNITQLIDQLVALNWLAPPKPEQAHIWLECLTKDELYRLYSELSASCLVHRADAPSKITKSSPKAVLLSACKTIPARDLIDSSQCTLVNEYRMRSVDEHIGYFLFLYFGNTKSALNQFSLRDLGIMNTREERAQMQARFTCKHSALLSYRLSRYLSEVRRSALDSEDAIEARIEQLPGDNNEIDDPAVKEKYAGVMFELAKAMLAFNRDKALALLAIIDLEQAQEKWCREAHKAGYVESVNAQLMKIIDDPLSDRILHFAQDFLARKYHQKRTSVLTDMLREGNQHLRLDEVHRGSVERAVIAHYKSQFTCAATPNHQGSLHAIRTENILWRSLFGLVFWQELFDLPGLGLATPFDFMPSCLKQNSFYRLAQEHIDTKLDALCTANDMMSLLSRNAAENFGKGQGIFHWRADLLENLDLLVQHAPIEGIKCQLLRMCKDWQGCHDGYPDIMVIENSALRFEEIKAQGDVLRRNQLACIQSLREHGFDVRITTVDFITDPMQPYVVVDIETTGGRAQHHKITEIGMVKMVDGQIVDRWQSLLNPQRRIPKNITALTGITDEMVADAPLFSDVAEEIDSFTEGCIFVAHNVNFDYGFIKQEFARLERFWRRPKLCTVQQMRRYYKGLPSYSLANLTKHFSIDMQRHHRAMSDALAAGELLKLVNEKRFASLSASSETVNKIS